MNVINSPNKKLDKAVFFILILFILFYQLQLAVSWITVLKVRELLYLFLYLRILICYDLRFTKKQVLLFTFLLFTLLISLNTLVLFGPAVALKGLLRFINVALLAPLVSILFSTEKEIKIFISIWLFVAFVGAITAVYQLLGGDLNWLVRDYIAIRGNLIRYKTILGEPNVGGIAATVTLIYTFLTWKRTPVQIGCLVFATVLLILSVSKAAIGAFAIGIFLIYLLNYKQLFAIRVRRFYVIAVSLLFLLSIMVFANMEGSLQGFTEYFTETVKSFAGINSARENSALKELLQRMVGVTAGIDASYFTLWQFMVGGSYGIAGSAALQYNSQAVLPHNSFLEVYLVGGMFPLIVFILLILSTFHSLAKLKSDIKLKKALNVIYLILVAYMLGYPVIYEPIMGTLFWLITGAAANKNLIRRIESE